MSDIRELLRTTHVCEDMAGAALALIREQDDELVRLRDILDERLPNWRTYR